jgi:hypothetical protein
MNDGDDMQQLKQDVADIKRALLGSEAYKEAGLMQRVSGLERWRESLSVKIAGVVGGAAVVFWIAGKFIH